MASAATTLSAAARRASGRWRPVLGLEDPPAAPGSHRIRPRSGARAARPARRSARVPARPTGARDGRSRHGRLRGTTRSNGTVFQSGWATGVGGGRGRGGGTGPAEAEHRFGPVDRLGPVDRFGLIRGSAGTPGSGRIRRAPELRPRARDGRSAEAGLLSRPKLRVAGGGRGR